MVLFCLFIDFFRCRRMLIILSENFLRSPACEFQASFATGLAIGNNLFDFYYQKSIAFHYKVPVKR